MRVFNVEAAALEPLEYRLNLSSLLVLYASGVQKSEPFTSNKLSVSHQMCNTVFAGKTEEPRDEFHALFSVGVASLPHHLEDDRKGHSIVDDTESEDIDIRVTEPPAGPVHGQ